MPPTAISVEHVCKRYDIGVSGENMFQYGSLRESMADLWLGFTPDEVRGWLEDSQFEITGATVVGAPDSLQLITFQGQKK